MHTQRRDQLGRYITFKAETQIYLLRLVASLKERIPCRLPSGKRPNGLLRNVEGIAGWGGRVPRRKSGRLHLDYLARYTMEGPAWHLSSPLPLHLHLRHVFSRRLMRPNAGVHASPRVPVNAHGISYLTDEDIYDNPRTGHPTHSLSPVPWTKTYDVTLPPPPPIPFFLILLPYFIGGNFVVSFRFRTWEGGCGSYQSLLSVLLGEERNLSTSQRIETSDCYSSKDIPLFVSFDFVLEF